MITIFTPTYNRAYTLPKLFESLQAQTSNHFEWLIVDDGSSDCTQELVEHFTARADFKITYIYQENQGKHVAINTALDKVSTPYFFTVDSDDYLKDNAIELIFKKLETIKNSKTIIGIASPIEMVNDTDLPKNQLKSEIITTPFEMKYKHQIMGEFTLVYKTEVINKFRYPIFLGEKFIVESYITNRFKKDYKLLHISESIVVGEYRNDGLTMQSKNLLLNNPKGASLAFCEKANNDQIPFKERKILVKSYWDYESIFNTNFIQKLKKIKSIRLRIFIITFFFGRIFRQAFQ
ncbi:glycosyltransferase family 2 protein [Chryseobacterium sp. CFBP8996]|uniref:glycosyltransferase family 2 protein n=1 Tax=Chryseobacterium sp. CFBP8996 TaxID=3096529 RepID=UPI002A69CEA4|nr:glycosyltransferase family 2 protein [Chryseobacterium sp. CFBP8996]MDY0929513.1 glycosyltransferase family 2 protein [Chryseobacterium sp. CFBP8996]